MAKLALIDGANVALDEKTSGGKGKIENITKMKKILQEKGFKPVVIVDANLRHNVDDKTQYEHLEDEGIIRQAPAGAPADYFLLELASREDAVIISNDRFQQYKNQFPNIEDKRIPYMVVNGKIMLYCPEESKK